MRLLSIAILAASALAFAGNANAQTSCGKPSTCCATSAKKGHVQAAPAPLPLNATNFLATYYPTCTITKCSLEKKGYEVDLADGTDLNFDRAGNWTEIDAPDNAVLPAEVVNGVLPANVIAKINEAGVAGKVESISRNARKGYKVEIQSAEPDDYYFANDGSFIACK